MDSVYESWFSGMNMPWSNSLQHRLRYANCYSEFLENESIYWLLSSLSYLLRQIRTGSVSIWADGKLDLMMYVSITRIKTDFMSNSSCPILPSHSGSDTSSKIENSCDRKYTAWTWAAQGDTPAKLLQRSHQIRPHICLGWTVGVRKLLRLAL